MAFAVSIEPLCCLTAQSLIERVAVAANSLCVLPHGVDGSCCVVLRDMIFRDVPHVM